MESSSLASIKALVNKIKQKMFSNEINVHSFVSPSAYDTAWLAMLPDSRNRDNPMFQSCLDWVLNNQKEQGFWGGLGGDDVPTIDTLPATLACMVALSTWNVGAKNIEKGMSFVLANAKTLLKEGDGHLRRWFTIVFPAMLKLAQAKGLHLNFPDELKEIISSIYYTGQQNIKIEELDDKFACPPLLSYLEVLPSTCEIDQQVIVKNLDENGSLFQSTSATVFAYMATGNPKCLKYLESLVQKCPNGVPSVYPVDEGLIRLCMVDQIQKLGLAEHFGEEIEEILAQIYRSYMDHEVAPQVEISIAPVKIYKDSLAFRLLRLHGYNVTPWIFCWFLNHQNIMDHLEENFEQFASSLYNVYSASDLTFSGECELEEARSFSRRLLEKALSLDHGDDNVVIFPSFKKVVKQELSLPWIARLDHLDHRMWIEESKVRPLWIGKASFYRCILRAFAMLSCLDDEILMQLAVENYEFRQSIYKNELEEMKSWSKEWGLTEMGFGREKTTYCYFAVSAGTYLPVHSLIRKIVAKSAILITVADDFYDMCGSLNELQALSDAVQRWEGERLNGPSKIIFDALDEFVRDTAEQFLHQEGHDIIKKLQALWKEAFDSWMKEAMWAKTGYIPSMDEYLGTAVTSIAAHTIVLSSSLFLTPRLPSSKLNPPHYETITKLLMVATRLLNEIQSYQKEQEEGKRNLVLLYLNDNPNANIEDSIAYVTKILDEKRKEFLELVLRDDFIELPKSCKHLHLSCLKVFQMFFNSTNHFDSDTSLLEDIKKAIYVPPMHPLYKTIKPQFPTIHITSKKDSSMTINACFGKTLKVQTLNFNGNRSLFIRQRISKTSSIGGCKNVIIPPEFSLCFI